MPETTNEERLAVLARLQQMGISPGSGLNDLTDDVRCFHVMFGHPAPEKPEMQSRDLVLRRCGWIGSEVVELRNAASIEEQADAYLDIIYFAVGGLVELGIKFTQRLWRLVQGANIAKVWPDGSVRKNDAGKVLKPDGWQSPDDAIAAAIAEEANGTAKDDPSAQDSIINNMGNHVVEKLSIAKGGHVNMIMFIIDSHGFVASTSNMDLADQRDFVRYIAQSLATGAVTIEGTVQ